MHSAPNSSCFQIQKTSTSGLCTISGVWTLLFSWGAIGLSTAAVWITYLLPLSDDQGPSPVGFEPLSSKNETTSYSTELNLQPKAYSEQGSSRFCNAKLRPFLYSFLKLVWWYSRRVSTKSKTGWKNGPKKSFSMLPIMDGDKFLRGEWLCYLCLAWWNLDSYKKKSLVRIRWV